MQSVHATVTLRWKESTWTCDPSCGLFEGRWTAFSKEYFDLYPVDFCSQLQLKPDISWEDVLTIEIVKVENIGFREAGWSWF